MSYDIDLVVDHADGYKTTVHEANITYNLRAMFVAAGLPDSLWSLNGLPANQAAELLYPVWRELRTHPDRYEAFNAENGWGRHKHALPFIHDLYLAARCHPRAMINVS